MIRRRRTASLLLVVLAAFTSFAAVPSATAVEPPSVRVFAASTSIDVVAGRNGQVYVDPGVWIASVGGAFELRVFREDYTSPIQLVQVDAVTGEVLRTLPVERLEGWSGLSEFLHVSIKDPEGKVVQRYPMSFCPSSYYRARLDDEGPLVSRYPYFCGGMPLTRGAVWGIDDRWAVSPFSDFGFFFQAERHHYRMRVWIDPEWAALLGVAPEDAEATVALNVHERGTLAAVPRPIAPPQAPFPNVDTVEDPDPLGLPDLVGLPAWNVTTYHRRGGDFLAFNATEWNAGPGTLVVEGFRGVDEDEMDAFQYFLVDGVATGRAPIGAMEFHAAHRHWHFEEFTEYTLLDADSGEVQISGKQSWCLANTDAIDLTVPNANWGAFGGDLFTMCGGPGALWIREILDVGWGDTYSQYIAGQAFDITDLPNGDYYIRVHANPTGRIFEVNTDNNVVDRLIHLRGRPGARRVVVPPWNGIDTETRCPYCG
jgi:hypothetical protein